MALLIPTLLLHLLSLPFLVLSKSTIEPCSVSDTCNALAGYTLYTDLKVSEVAALFQVDPILILTANAFDISIPDVENHILPSGLFLNIPTLCSCADAPVPPTLFPRSPAPSTAASPPPIRSAKPTP
ncbi:LysM domain-containing GPI-anchored protein 1 [Platanthera zijinensis]|uniref:LysM domain-containing GPI-anchored protein 1 n=1 Tax=Platanthera zijinensis TaxID=2320716 RepID=A0AAP0B772_9ASPA